MIKCDEVEVPQHRVKRGTPIGFGFSVVAKMITLGPQQASHFVVPQAHSWR